MLKKYNRNVKYTIMKCRFHKYLKCHTLNGLLWNIDPNAAHPISKSNCRIIRGDLDRKNKNDQTQGNIFFVKRQKEFVYERIHSNI